MQRVYCVEHLALQPTRVMALEVSSSMRVSSIRRFPQDVREELNKLLQRKSWQSLSREFSIDIFTGLQPSALDDIVDLVDDSYPDFKRDVEKRMTILKKTTRGQTQSFKGKSVIGMYSKFYRYFYVLCFHHPCDKLEIF